MAQLPIAAIPEGEELPSIGPAAGHTHTAVWTEEGEVFTFGYGMFGNLGHGGTQNEPVPRLVEAVVGKKVVGAAAGDCYTAVWTAAGELFTFGHAGGGRLGHGEGENKPVPRLVDVLAGKQVISAAAGHTHTAVWTEEGEVFTFGVGSLGQLGHGEEEGECVPRLVEAVLDA